jgi:hypothetical protein
MPPNLPLLRSVSGLIGLGDPKSWARRSLERSMCAENRIVREPGSLE